MGSRKKDRKETITIRVKKTLIDKLREIKNYNALIEKLLEKYFDNRS